MTREDIERAGKQYANEHRNRMQNVEQYSMYDFMAGAEWRINSAWHDASQEPTEKKIIVVINSEDVISQISFLVGADNWNDCVKEADIVKWCYKQDLLPNMEE